MQRIDHDLGQLLRQVLGRRLYRELGFTSFERYAEERADVSPRTARRWVRLARLGPAEGAVASALRSGEITAMQASVIAGASAAGSRSHATTGATAAVAHARGVTLRRLEQDFAPASPCPAAIRFSAPPEAAIVFRLALEAVRLHLEAESLRTAPGGAANPCSTSAVCGASAARARPRPGARDALRWMIAHAIAEWSAQGDQFDDYADFNRDGFRCTAPGCTARRNLQSHHVAFRSAGGPDVPWNRTTLCAFHHLRGVHAGTLSCSGRAPSGLVFALGVRVAGPPLLRARSGDVLLAREAA